MFNVSCSWRYARLLFALGSLSLFPHCLLVFLESLSQVESVSCSFLKCDHCYDIGVLLMWGKISGRKRSILQSCN